MAIPIKFENGVNQRGTPINVIRIGSLCMGASTISSDLSIEGEKFMFIIQIVF